MSDSQKSDEKKGDDLLKRLLKTPPRPHPSPRPAKNADKVKGDKAKGDDK